MKVLLLFNKFGQSKMDVQNQMKIWHQYRLTCNELSHFRVHRLPQESKQCWNTSGVPHSDLVIIHCFAVDEVPQSATRVPLHLHGFVVQQVHQVFDSSQSTHLSVKQMRWWVIKNKYIFNIKSCFFWTQQKMWRNNFYYDLLSCGGLWHPRTKNTFFIYFQSKVESSSRMNRAYKPRLTFIVCVSSCGWTLRIRLLLWLDLRWTLKAHGLTWKPFLFIMRVFLNKMLIFLVRVW